MSPELQKACEQLGDLAADTWFRRSRRWRIKPVNDMGKHGRWHVTPPFPVVSAVHSEFWAPDLPTAFKWIELAIASGGSDW